MKRVLRHIHLGFLALLGAFLALQVLGALLGWNGRAPDVVYGDEMNIPEEFVLFLVGIALYRHNNHARFFATAMALLNGIAAAFYSDLDIFTLSRPLTFCWFLIWSVIFAGASWPSIRLTVETKRKQLKAS